MIVKFVFRALLEREENKDSPAPQVSRWVLLSRPSLECPDDFGCFTNNICVRLVVFIL